MLDGARIVGMSPRIMTGMPLCPDGSSGISQMYVPLGDASLVVMVVIVVVVVGFGLVVVGFGLLKWINSNLSGASFAACLLTQEAALCNAFSNT